jgi:hypothetical protein
MASPPSAPQPAHDAISVTLRYTGGDSDVLTLKLSSRILSSNSAFFKELISNIADGESGMTLEDENPHDAGFFLVEMAKGATTAEGWRFGWNPVFCKIADRWGFVEYVEQFATKIWTHLDMMLAKSSDIKPAAYDYRTDLCERVASKIGQAGALPPAIKMICGGCSHNVAPNYEARCVAYCGNECMNTPRTLRSFTVPTVDVILFWEMAQVVISVPAYQHPSRFQTADDLIKLLASRRDLWSKTHMTNVLAAGDVVCLLELCNIK